MDLPLTRELARLASILELLRTQREAFSELSDIKEFRGLESDFSDALKEAQVRSLVTQDPVSVVRADWQRMVRWSNRVQEALRQFDELGQELSSGLAGQGAEAGRKRKKVQTDWKPNISQLRELEHALKGGPSQLTAVIDQARAEVQTEDWNDQWPYPELTEVAEAMGWGESLELAEPLGPWAEGVASRARPLVATRMATDPGSPMLQRRIESMRMKLSQVRSLQEKHASHRTTLEEVGRLTETGQVETARRLIGTLQAAFGGLDYSAREQRLAQLEKQLKSQSEKVAETKKELQELGREAGGFFAFPPIGLMRRGSVAQGTAEKVVAEAAQIGKVGGNSEVDRMVSAWTTGLKSDLDSLQTLWMSRVRRWILGTTVFWLVVLVASGVTFQQVRAGQERERQRVEAEEKAAEEKASAEAKVKAETEERERQRLVAEKKAAEEKALAEAKAKVEAAETALASKLGLSKPFVAGVRGQAGDLAVRWIPSGRFTMGSPTSEPDRSSDEVQHEVVLTRGFFLAETECTQGQLEKVMGGNPSAFKGSERPVELVSWEEAVEYCRKLTAKQRAEGILPEGWEWRLPTEAEWEYAARAGTTGPRYGELDAIGWYSGNSGSETHPVSQKAANAWGLHDMIGNVLEWCSDWYGDYWYGDYSTASVTNPTGLSSGADRVRRGGSWYYGAGLALSAFRSGSRPGNRSDDLGFRPALSSVR
jgi:formylglycine-generating enzyme required for sulfatase activity